MRVGVIGSSANEGTANLVERWRAIGIDARLVTGTEALATLRPTDVAVARLDIRPTLDGIEDGLLAVLRLERRGIEVMNPAAALLAAHDKLRTARLLAAAHLPHPATVHARSAAEIAGPYPFVLKPRFGSWGADVALCGDGADVARYLTAVSGTSWFLRHGVLRQELVPNGGHDLRVLVAGGRVAGAIMRIAAPGEWRTNISLGGTSASVALPEGAGELAVTAAIVAGADLVGVDLMPRPDGSLVVIEVNAAVDFDDQYSFAGEDVYATAGAALGLRPHRRRDRAVSTSHFKPTRWQAGILAGAAATDPE